jgi:hypothetical protein
MIFLQQLNGELRKLFARPRTWMGYGAFLAMEAVILAVYKLEASQRHMRGLVERNGLEFNTYYSSLTITFTIMLLSMFLLGSIYFALVAGDIVAKENEDGNLRMVFARPISRLRLLAVKYTAVCLYTFSFVFFVGVSGYAMAVAAVGWFLGGRRGFGLAGGGGGGGGGAFRDGAEDESVRRLSGVVGGSYATRALGRRHRDQHDHTFVDRIHVLLLQDQARGGDDHHAHDPVRGHDPAGLPVLQTL